MKKYFVHSLMIATVMLGMTACNSNDDSEEFKIPQEEQQGKEQEEQIFNENKTFTLDHSGATIVYQSRIGYDFDSALDSLIRRYEPILKTAAIEGHYSGEGFNIDKQKINVNFSYDSRAFVLLTFIDKANIYNYLFTGDVIDEKGNLYRLIECED